VFLYTVTRLHHLAQRAIFVVLYCSLACIIWLGYYYYYYYYCYYYCTTSVSYNCHFCSTGSHLCM